MRHRHPLHPALVHFPVACWSLATAADFAGFIWGEPVWRLAGILMVTGTVIAVAAIAAGFIEYMKLDENSPALPDVHRHMLLAATAWSCYAASLFLRVQTGSLSSPDGFAVALSAAGFVSLGCAGWMGARLVYGHGIGVAKPPSS
ncbi:putative membrane protein [Lysobacter niastensis]|uniref:Membrane protein n=1 Tax=Lysobacter niastensis TaxID=380629 RepID=A0ABU1WEC5_9GAMM|nr:DUF2231 domain-containing protein [Lysobacter niastensis]MDR7135972.1 putative membrane protein [Lysobacter niastensis]